jgi:nuclear pore complex protein Nup133
MKFETIKAKHFPGPSLVSVQLSNCGWAWLVCGRRLLIWQYKQNGPSKWQSVSQCRELTLPPSDLAHRAELVIVFTSKKAPTPSCIAVSPEGAVRYWPSIAHEGSWIEECADLQVKAGFIYMLRTKLKLPQ